MGQIACVVLAVACVVACDSGTKASSSECSATATAIVTKLSVDNPQSEIQAAIADVSRLCSEDHWTPEARNCFRAMKTAEDVRACSYTHITQQQKDRFESATAPLVAKRTFARAIAKLRDFRDKMCVCKEHDAACAQRVNDEMTSWAQEEAKDVGVRPPKPTEEEMRQATEVTEQLGKCMQKAMKPRMEELARPDDD